MRLPGLGSRPRRHAGRGSGSELVDPGRPGARPAPAPRGHRPAAQRQDRAHHQPRPPPAGRRTTCRSSRRCTRAAISAPGCCRRRPGDGLPLRPLPRRPRRQPAALAGSHRPAGHACGCEIAYRTTSLVLRQVSPIQHLTLEIIDYPGEWLLDLPLLEESFDELLRARRSTLPSQPPRAALARPWLERLRAFDADGPGRPGRASPSSRPPTPPICAAATSELRLSLVQPGRFTNPGELAGHDILRFCPLPPGPVPLRLATGRAMAGRFERLSRGRGPPLLRRAFQPLRPPDRAGRPALQPQCRPRPLRRHAAGAGRDPAELPLRRDRLPRPPASRRGSTRCCSPPARPTTWPTTSTPT